MSCAYEFTESPAASCQGPRVLCRAGQLAPLVQEACTESRRVVCCELLRRRALSAAAEVRRVYTTVIRALHILRVCSLGFHLCADML